LPDAAACTTDTKTVLQLQSAHSHRRACGVSFAQRHFLLFRITSNALARRQREPWQTCGGIATIPAVVGKVTPGMERSLPVKLRHNRSRRLLTTFCSESKWQPAAAVALMRKSDKTVTNFGRRFARKSKKKLTRFAITVKRPKQKNSVQTTVKLHYETKIHFTMRVS
jgi:hypothetical protein